MQSNIIATIAITRSESQHHLYHNNTRVSVKKKKNRSGERIKITKQREKRKKRNRECRMAGMHQ